jgi:sulfite exporter TauE/SafE
MFTLGLGTSLHCVSMCGPLVLTYAVKGTEGGPWYRKLTPNLAYQGAKLTSYMLVGLLLGTVGSILNIDVVRPYIMFLAGAFMIVLGLGMTGRVRWAARLTPRPPKWLMNALMKLRRRSVSDAESGESRFATPVFFGLMTGLLPCGPLMAAQVSAAASGSPAAGALGMALFALGTAPLMLVFGTAGSLIPLQWKNRLMNVLAVGVIVFGLVFINRGLMLTGAPVNFNTVKTAFVGGQVAETSDTQYTTAADGVVEVPLVIENTQFVPSTVQIPADKPVRLVVDRREAAACSDQLSLPQLGVLVNLTPNGVTKVDVPATKAGTYTLTCGMGMMSGQLAVGGAAAGNPSPLPWLALAAAGAGVGLYVLRRREAAAAEAARKAAQHSKKGHKQDPAKKAAAVTASVTTQAGGVLGLKPQEIIWIAAAVAAAVMVGLATGGMFR